MRNTIVERGKNKMVNDKRQTDILAHEIKKHKQILQDLEQQIDSLMLEAADTMTIIKALESYSLNAEGTTREARPLRTPHMDEAALRHKNIWGA